MAKSQQRTRKPSIYRVGYYIECGSAVLVEAASEDEATSIVEAHLDDTHEELPGSDCLHFDCGITDVEKVGRGTRLPAKAATAALTLDDDQARALGKLVDYVWDNEARSYEDSEPDARDNHIFTSLRIIGLACGYVSVEDLASFDANLTEAEK